jgi:hypothetical protein
VDAAPPRSTPLTAVRLLPTELRPFTASDSGMTGWLARVFPWPRGKRRTTRDVWPVVQTGRPPEQPRRELEVL